MRKERVAHIAVGRIQRGTNHAWSNRSGKPVRMLYVLIDGAHGAELAAALAKANPGHA